MRVFFDDSLPILVRTIIEHFGVGALKEGVVLRDVTGRLAFFLGIDVDPVTLDRVSSRLINQLGPYARTDRVLASASDFGVEDIRNDATTLVITVEGNAVRLLDRRLAGADWLRAPAPAVVSPPRFVFASLKGGVGRSTALCVAAADIAAKGRRVLALDLDMEAPGLGAMLLTETTLPEFGLIDALVENGIAPLDDAFLSDLVGPSPLTHRNGRIDVVPAFGRRSLNNPSDILSKLARAYVEDVNEDGTVATILDQIRDLIDGFSRSERYDAIFVDSRAGLHETTAAAILGLGAEVFLFGLNEPQTFEGYSALLSHLARFIRRGDPRPEWLERLTMVNARALDDHSYRSFADQCRILFAKAGLGPSDHAPASAVPLPAEPFKDVPWDDDISDTALMLDEETEPRQPLAIFEDERFRLFQPTTRGDLLTEGLYRSSYGMFLDRISEVFQTKPET